MPGRRSVRARIKRIQGPRRRSRLDERHGEPAWPQDQVGPSSPSLLGSETHTDRTFIGRSGDGGVRSGQTMLPSPRLRRLKDPASFSVAHDHCMSRVVKRDFVFGPQEREHFVRLLREYEGFCGIRVLTDCVRSNHSTSWSRSRRSRRTR